MENENRCQENWNDPMIVMVSSRFCSCKKLQKWNKNRLPLTTLNANNHWTTEFNGLEKYDSTGEKYDYEVKEESTSTINGNTKSGYEAAYEVKEDTDKSTDITTITTDITNTHTPDSITKSIMKKWDDNNDIDGIRPESVTFHLLGNGEVVDTVTLTDQNGWKAESKLLPKKDHGKRSLINGKK